MDEWSEILEFPGYYVNRSGEILSESSDRKLRLTCNQHDVVQVGLMKNGVQYKRGVALLVAKAFLPRTNKSFDTPINLNGDRQDNRVENLLWRPRWFAIKYHQQFHNGKRGFDRPVVDTDTGDIYPTSWDAAVIYGLLDRDIMHSVWNNTLVWPTYQKFELVDD